MSVWHWIICGVVVLAIPAALFGLDRLCLWLEERGWLYYRKRKPTSSAASAWVAMQQFIEPGVKHVVQVKQEQRNERDAEGNKDRLLATLLAILDSIPINSEQIRYCLAAAKRAGLDWKGLYEEAVRVQLSVRPAQAALIPSAEQVEPVE